jgi:hypothetical protein
VNSVGVDGRVGDPLQVVPTARNAYSIRTDNTNRFVFAPHLGTDQVFQFLFDEKSGRLTAMRRLSRANMASYTAHQLELGRRDERSRRWTAKPEVPGSNLSWWRPDCVAGHVGLELRNVVPKYPFEISRRLPVIHQKLAARDFRM